MKTRVTIIHIVRRYGLFGGMESYVCHLTHELLNFDLNIEVVCEQFKGDPDKRITLHTIKKSSAERRWAAMIDFRKNVNLLLASRKNDRFTIIHSHERCMCHQVTTFHGPPFNAHFLSYLSARVRAWKQMEKEEICGPSVQAVLTVSQKICETLSHRYPALTKKKIYTAYPGVNFPKSSEIVTPSRRKPTGKVIFVGREWKRKGLAKAIEIIQAFRGEIVLHVFGPDPKDLPRYMKDLREVEFKGWHQTIPWREYDAIIHPAISEPFGMVISEARAFGVPALISREVGAGELDFSGIKTLDLFQSTKDWVEALNDLLQHSHSTTNEILWTWAELAELHATHIYTAIEL